MNSRKSPESEDANRYTATWSLGGARVPPSSLTTALLYSSTTKIPECGFLLSFHI